MAQLDCNVKSCCHNEDNCCCLSSIEVNGSNACNCEDTCCGSYFEDKSGEKNSAQTPHVSLSIACQATNCMYNDDKVCHADHVDISGAAFGQQVLKSLPAVLGAGKCFISVHPAVEPAGVLLNQRAVVAYLCGQRMQHGILPGGNSGIGRDPL